MTGPADDAPLAPPSLAALRPTPRRWGILGLVVGGELLVLLTALVFPAPAVRGYAMLALLVGAPVGAVILQLFVRIPGSTAAAFLPLAAAGTVVFGGGGMIPTTLLAGGLAICAVELPFAVGQWRRWTAARTAWAPVLGGTAWTIVLVIGDAVIASANGRIAYAGIIIVPAAWFVIVVAVASWALRQALRSRAPV